MPQDDASEAEVEHSRNSNPSAGHEEPSNGTNDSTTVAVSPNRRRTPMRVTPPARKAKKMTARMSPGGRGYTGRSLVIRGVSGETTTLRAVAGDRSTENGPNGDSANDTTLVRHPGRNRAEDRASNANSTRLIGGSGTTTTNGGSNDTVNTGRTAATLPANRRNNPPSVANFYETTVRPSRVLRNFSGPSRHFVNMLRTFPLDVFVRDTVKGIFTLLYINKFASFVEGNVYPLLRATGASPDAPLFQRPEPDRVFYTQNNIITVCPRRRSKAENEIVMKPSSTAVAGQYRTITAVAVLDNNTKEAKRNLCNATVRLLKASGVNARVKNDFDQTEQPMKPLDHYLTDECIICLIQDFWKEGPAGTTFYQSNPEYRDYIFSRPYPLIAQSELGYPTNENGDNLPEQQDGPNPPQEPLVGREPPNEADPNNQQGMVETATSDAEEDTDHDDDEVVEVENPAGPPSVQTVDDDTSFCSFDGFDEDDEGRKRRD